MEKVVEQLRKWTLPIFVDSAKVNSNLGSGIIVEIESESLFFITAYHVLTDISVIDNHVCLPSNRAGKAVIIKFHEVDSLLDLANDFAVIPIHQEIKSMLKVDYTTVPFQHLQIDENINSNVFFCGYPKSYNKLKGSYRNLPEKLFTGYSENFEFKDDFIHINAQRKHAYKKDGTKITPPKFYGMSGGGIYEHSSCENRLKLVGLTIGASDYYSDKIRKRQGIKGVSWLKIIESSKIKFPAFKLLI